MSTATTILAPLVVEPGQSRTGAPIELTGHSIDIKALGEDTGGQFAIGFLTAPPMTGPPLHVHSREDEWFYVLKGELLFQVGDEFIVAGPGTSLFAPRDIPHTWQNFGPETVEAIGLITPPDAQGFFLDSRTLRQDVATLGALGTRYGIRLVGPPLTNPSQKIKN
ncbi:MAG: cupin domain-containing protein [Acidobacteriota bacterium]